MRPSAEPADVVDGVLDVVRVNAPEALDIVRDAAGAATSGGVANQLHAIQFCLEAAGAEELAADLEDLLPDA